MDTDKEIFAGKTFASLAKDIYFNSSRKSAQIDQLIKDLRQMIKDAGSATVIAPMIKDYLDVSVKNDDQLVKLSAVLQRYLGGGAGGDSSGDGVGSGLTDSEKEELLKSVKLEVDELKKAESEINVDLETLQKNKSKK
tara:strand:+ start:793 stop:1206 length:414 start_codon:yes stop_codon:yes gene_type:complete